MTLYMPDADGDPITDNSLVVDCCVCETMILSHKAEYRIPDHRPVCRACSASVHTEENAIYAHSRRCYMDPNAPSATEEDDELEWEMRYSELYRLVEDGPTE